MFLGSDRQAAHFLLLLAGYTAWIAYPQAAACLWTGRASRVLMLRIGAARLPLRKLSAIGHTRALSAHEIA